MKTAIATIIAAASFSLLAAQVSAETISNQEWVASQHFNGPGVGAVRAPEFTVDQDPQAWVLSDRNSPPKTFKRTKAESKFNQDPQAWQLSERNSPPKTN